MDKKAISKAAQKPQTLREAIKFRLAMKGARARILIGRLNEDDKAMIWKPGKLDEVALELRHLAFQIKALQDAKRAIDEA